jgi:hypothetical protein
MSPEQASVAPRRSTGAPMSGPWRHPLRRPDRDAALHRDAPRPSCSRSSRPSPPRRASLVPGLPLDLELIMMRCLRKEPQERYDSARALADDLDRYLAGKPIEARRATVWYGCAKRARRNPAFPGGRRPWRTGDGRRRGGPAHRGAARSATSAFAALLEEGERARGRGERPRDDGAPAARARLRPLRLGPESRGRAAVATGPHDARARWRSARREPAAPSRAALEVDSGREGTRAALAENLLARALSWPSATASSASATT